MEAQPSSALSRMVSERAEVDTARPFRSVKEAVAIFGERIISCDTAYSQKINKSISHEITPRPTRSSFSSLPSYSSPSSQLQQDQEDDHVILNSLKKLEAELEETKRELMLLKERESEREVTVASLNAEIHKNMAKIAEIEAVGAANAAKTSIDTSEVKTESDIWEEERSMELEPSYEYLPSLAHVLRLGELDGNFDHKKKTKKLAKAKKKKPIIPLISDMFSRKKVFNEHYHSLYNYPFSGLS
ncbi:WEB family protein At1g75720-like [Dioscorea cayenensis subsp. rotundata]|uniref:WEB family protein At1g75720-like n=1 Tax=Dioscorea cayennensis subsp. rotundata TaxID=55577 RepID=A0AB40AQA3_DIOCR|nr:WEB family protein At1g75720-like [Dioscorea cayenensis subsp. rotundata]XP_039117098.1 WEB family protein At1g75720-like [Dioscorea cayenensis subsp. rotundata]XP_039117099.1 WEB family protein At1g75720-like [Dioscorea cayenensis subsp. rotundata]XP_039117100.1 WEB family protein At1g75720-like [Dioscorea cayenensis subsp. rotundata]XP_039117101.1 WEB family protein At1g75720-like [Dioscorea cayenensis subsp. rotundata]XP_039117102.1 WEB family protein At1g75720-like [Dioscorea cayenensis